MMQGGKRRRPRWSATVVWVLLWATPATAAFQNSQSSSTSSSWPGKAFVGGDNSQPAGKTPSTVVLREGHNQNRKVRPRRSLEGDDRYDRRTLYDATFSEDTTPFPSFSVPTPSPSFQKNREGPPSITAGSVVHIPDLEDSTKEPSTSTPLLSFAAVPVGFDVLLETADQQDLDDMAQQAKQILQEHLTVAFQQGFADQEGIIIRSVDLNVRAFETPTRRRLGISRLLQNDLAQAITLEARGVAGFQVNRNAVDTELFLAQVNSLIDKSVQPERLTDLFQNGNYGVSDSFRVASVLNSGTDDDEEGDKDENQKSKPTTVEIVIAFSLIVLMALSLGAYGYIFWRKRQKRLKRRKQFGVKTPSSSFKGPRPRPHGASITPTAAQLATSPPGSSNRPPPTNFPPGVVHATSSESSYKGLGSLSEDDDADNFAKELRLAASLDRRAWDDFQQRALSHESESHAYPQQHPADGYNAQNEIYRDIGMDDDQQGIEMAYRNDEMHSPPGLTIAGDTVSIQSNSSFPYGDEHDPPSPSRAYKPGGSPHQHESKRDDYMSAGVKEFEELERDDSSGGWRMTKMAESELNKEQPKPKRNSPRPFSFLYHGTESNLEPETHETFEDEPIGNISREHSDPTTAGAFRGSPMSQSWSTNPPRTAGSNSENGTAAAVRGSPRGSPGGSWNSSNRAVPSQDGSLRPSPFGSTRAVNEEAASNGSTSSVLTSDMLKEVQRLSQFVKRYERKKEHRHKREQEHGYDDIDLSNSHSLSTSMDYDSLMEQVTSLQKVVDPGAPGSLKNASSLEITRKVTSSTRSSTPPNQIDRMDSMQSSDSSDIDTMESDDLSRRLGITPFSVQKPLAYSNPVIPNSQNHSISHIQTAYYERRSSPPEKSPQNRGREGIQEITPRSFNNNRPSQSTLNSLRHKNGAILDNGSAVMEAPSDEFRTSMIRNNQRHRAMEAPSDEFRVSDIQRHQRHSSERPFTPTIDPKTITPRKRTSSGNRGFDGIVNMFESKEREPLYPPSESWQYNY